MRSDTDLPHQPDTLPQQPHHSFKSRKLLSFIAAALLIALVAGIGGYLLTMKNSQLVFSPMQQLPQAPLATPQTISTPSLVLLPIVEPIISVDWKTYINEQLGISFKYPNAWEVKSYPFSHEEEQISHEVLDLFFQDPKDHRTDIAYLYYYHNPKTLSLESFEQERRQVEKSDLVPPIYSPTDEPRLLPNGLTAYYRKNAICEPVECQIYTIPFKDKIFVFYNSQYNQVLNQNQIFDQVLSTFKFFE
jgi:hypothetical protein